MQINTFDVSEGQQGYYDHFYKWLIVVEDRTVLFSLEGGIGNITNLLALTTSQVNIYFFIICSAVSNLNVVVSGFTANIAQQTSQISLVVI